MKLRELFLSPYLSLAPSKPLHQRRKPKMYFVKTPQLLKKVFANQTWSLSENDKTIYLTFDDGPTQTITDWTLDVLKDFNAKATFFLVGQNAMEQPQLVKRMQNEDHSIGNHTFNHLNGWMTRTNAYLKNILECDRVLHSRLFRPPYGKITTTQTRLMSKRFNIIMWDVLSGDFDQQLDKEKCLENVIENTAAGSIVVFHDSVKAFDRMQYTLPRMLEHFSALGFSFKAIPQHRQVLA